MVTPAPWGWSPRTTRFDQPVASLPPSPVSSLTHTGSPLEASLGRDPRSCRPTRPLLVCLSILESVPLPARLGQVCSSGPTGGRMEQGLRFPPGQGATGGGSREEGVHRKCGPGAPATEGAHSRPSPSTANPFWSAPICQPSSH